MLRREKKSDQNKRRLLKTICRHRVENQVIFSQMKYSEKIISRFKTIKSNKNFINSVFTNRITNLY